ncbi:MAG TPA: energy transducer TonB [Opitutaceae bacterium]|nr:energy transducer TonB [Opitutaceae bacterium]
MPRVVLPAAICVALILACQTWAEVPSGHIYSPTDVTTPVHATVQPPPAYPASLQKSGVAGFVVVDFIAGADGLVHEPRASQYSNAAFAAPAVESVQHWKFKPAELDGHAVDCRLSAIVNFTPPNSHPAPRVWEKKVGDVPVYRGDQVTRHVVPLVRTPPKYPAALRKAGVTGEATVDFIVMPDGTVAQPTVFAATDPRFGEAAVACVKRWKFKPAERDGHPVATRMQVPIMFTLHR